MLDSWLVGFGIEYSDGGAVAKVAELAKATKDAGVWTRTLTRDITAQTAAFLGLDAAMRSATAGYGGFGAASRAAAGGSGAAATAARAQAGAFWIAAAAANAAAAAMARAGAASAGFGVGSFAAPAAVGRSWRDIGGGGFTALGSAAAYASGGRGGPPIGAQTYLPAGGGAPFALTGGVGGVGGVGPPRGGGGGWGGFNGSGFSSMAGTLGPGALRLGVRGAKLGAEAGLGLAWDAVHEAGRYQQIMTSVENVTGANAAQMARARKTTFDVGHMSATSVSESAEMLREITRQSQGAMPFNSMLDMLPYAAKLQVVLGATRGFTPTQTVDSTMALTHLFRQYDPKGMPKMFDTVLRMGELMPTDLNAAVRQMTYFEPVLKSLHVPDTDAATMMVAMSRFGMGKNKGGQSLADLADQALGPLQITKHVQAGKAALLGPKGLNVLDAHGTSRFFTDKGGQIFGFLDQLAKYEGQHGSIQSRKVFRSAFGSVGSRLASLVSDPVIIDQLHKVHDVIAKQKTLGLDSQAHSFFGNVNFGQKQAWSDFQSLMTEVGTMALPGVTKGFHDLADTLHGATMWLRGHADLEKHVQNEITSAVRETEGWIVGHQGDFRQFGKDALWMLDQTKTAGKGLSELADDIMLVSRAAHAVAGAYDSLPGPIKWAIARNKAIDEARRRHGFGDLTPSGAGAPYNPMDPFNTRHRLPSGPPAAVPPKRMSFTMSPGAIHIDARGLDAKQVAMAVEDGLRRFVTAGSSDPRHHTGKSGTIVTSARQPTRLTTTTGP